MPYKLMCTVHYFKILMITCEISRISNNFIMFKNNPLKKPQNYIKISKENVLLFFLCTFCNFYDSGKNHERLSKSFHPL